MQYCKNCMSEVIDEVDICPFCGKEMNTEIQPSGLISGTKLNNQYIVENAISHGYFEITYIGKNIISDMQVTIKEFFLTGCANRNSVISSKISWKINNSLDFYQKYLTRFIDEAHMRAELGAQDGLVTVHDCFWENNTAYVIMENFDGITLKEYMKKHGTPLSFDEAIQLLMPVMISLQTIHTKGIVYRNCVPNSIVVVDKIAKLYDFAMTNLNGVSYDFNVKSGFSATEQYFDNGKEGPWTDVYGFCAVIYFCITGIVPEDASEREYNDEIMLPSTLGAKITQTQEQVLMKGMSIAKENRYQNMQHLREALTGRNASKTKIGTKWFWVVGIMTAAMLLFTAIVIIAIGIG